MNGDPQSKLVQLIGAAEKLLRDVRRQIQAGLPVAQPQPPDPVSQQPMPALDATTVKSEAAVVVPDGVPLAGALYLKLPSYGESLN